MNKKTHGLHIKGYFIAKNCFVAEGTLNYWPSLCMFQNRALNFKINRLYEQCLLVLCIQTILSCSNNANLFLYAIETHE